MCIELSYLSACPIYLTIGLDGNTYQESAVQLNWAPDCYIRPEWYGFYREEPIESLLQPYLRIDDVKNSTFKMPLKQKVGKLKFPKGWNRNDGDVQPELYTNGKCLDYYVASFRGNELLTVECLKIYPTWMGQEKSFAKMKLKDFFIPGLIYV